MVEFVPKTTGLGSAGLGQGREQRVQHWRQVHREDRGQRQNSGRRQQQQRQHQGQHRNRGQGPNRSERHRGERRDRPAYAAASALPAPIAKERDAQMQEAHARMAADGEAPRRPAKGPRTRRHEPQLGALLRDKS